MQVQTLSGEQVINTPNRIQVITMTKKEYDEVWAELEAKVRRTSFPAPVDDAADDEWHRHTEHAEYGAARH